MEYYGCYFLIVKKAISREKQTWEVFGVTSGKLKRFGAIQTDKLVADICLHTNKINFKLTREERNKYNEEKTNK